MKFFTRDGLRSSDLFFLNRRFWFVFLVGATLRFVPLFFSSESLDITLYRFQAIPVLDRINPYSYYLAESFTNIRQPYVYLPLSMFYAPVCFELAKLAQLPFYVAINFPPIFFDLCLLVLIYGVLSKRKPGSEFAGGLLYALNPISILISSFHANVMAGPVFLTTLSYVLVSKEEAIPSDRQIAERLSALTLGLAIAWRTYPILFLPALLLKTKDRRSAWTFLCLTALPVGVTTLPFLI